MAEETLIIEQANFTINVKCPFCGKEYRDKEVKDFDCDCGVRIKITYDWVVEAWLKSS